MVLPAAAFPEKAGTFTNTERRVQLLKKAVAAPGEARPDWQIVCDIATAMGYPMAYANAAAIMEEIASLVPSYAGIRHERLTNGGLQWPCPTPRIPVRAFSTQSGSQRRAERLVHRADSAARRRNPDEDFPLLVDTGRQLEHYDTGTMTRRSRGLNYLRPAGEIEINPEDARRTALRPATARGSPRAGVRSKRACVSTAEPEGMVFYPFHYSRAAANRLVSAELDRASRTPALKGAAAHIERLPVQ